MRCPECAHAESRVVDSRESGPEVRRRRECLACGQRFTTYERVELPRLLVAKRDGRLEDFDAGKLRATLARLRSKRPVSDEQLATLVARLERGLREGANGAVTAAQLAARVVEQLEELDAVIAWRFGSGYERQTDGGLAKRLPAAAPAGPASALSPPTPARQLSLGLAPPEVAAAPAAPRPRRGGRRRGGY